MTDEELVALARQGDTAAFDALVVRHQAAVYRATLAALRVPEEAEDAAQDAFVRAWSMLSRFRGDASFKTWLLTIAWNRAMTRRRGLAHWLRRTRPLDDAKRIAGRHPRPDDAVSDTELRAHRVAEARRKVRSRLAALGDVDA